jgi:hypothetical protein
MTMRTYMTKAQLRDTMTKREARLSKIGQDAAVKYLNNKHRPKSSGAIRGALLILMIAFCAALMIALIDTVML